MKDHGKYYNATLTYSEYTSSLYLKLHRVRLQTIEQQQAQATGNAKNGWKMIRYVVKMIGPIGHSSDGSPNECKDLDAPYLVWQQLWRSEDLTRLLKMVDDHRSFRTVYGNFRPGQRPHKCVWKANGPDSARKAVSGLPRNFYRKAFIDTCTSWQLSEMRILEEVELPALNDEWDWVYYRFIVLFTTLSLTRLIIKFSILQSMCTWHPHNFSRLYAVATIRVGLGLILPQFELDSICWKAQRLALNLCFWMITFLKISSPPPVARPAISM